jgi:hypothetical protein
MSRTYDLPLDIPLSKSPEQIFEHAEAKRPRQYAMDIFKRYPEHERLAQVDRLVPPYFRDAVRQYLQIAAMRAQAMRVTGAT